MHLKYPGKPTMEGGWGKENESKERKELERLETW